MHYLLWAMCMIILSNQVVCDYYTSVVGLDILLVAESVLLDYFEQYFTQAELSGIDVDTVFTEVEDNFADLYKDLDTGLKYYENPLNAFKVIRRFVADWPKISNAAHGFDAENELNSSVSNLESQYKKPTNDDLIGAAKGLLRLQRTYALRTEDISHGILNKEKVSSNMLASDCYEIGRFLVENKEFPLAAEWLMQAQISWAAEQNKHENSSHWFGNLTEVKILENLAPILSILGHHKLAWKLNEELLSQDPNNKFGLENKPIYTINLVNERRTLYTEDTNDDDIPEVDKEVKLNKNIIYEQTCRGELRRSPREERQFRCRYTHNNVPFCFIAPFKMEEISFDPFVAVYYDAIYDNEINNIISIANETVVRSKVGDITKSEYSDIRTSKNSWLWFHENSFMNNIALRLTDITGLSLDSAEALQVANYGLGGHYGPHYDFSEGVTESNYGNRGNRILTALFYINEVQMGGGTAFPYLRILVPPTKRSLLVWFNMHQSLEVDYRTLHAGCPVLKGSKWICNEWFHERGQEFRRPCSTQQLGHKSVEYKNKYP